MAHQTRSKTKRKKQEHCARIVPPMLDELEAMTRHKDYLRSLLLWRSIFHKNYMGLTEEEDIECGAPRTRFRIAAIMEADNQWLSRSIQNIRKGGEALWAFDAVNGPCGDRTDSVSLHIPADLSLAEMQRVVGQSIREARKTSNVRPIQHPHAPEVDPWKVYDMMQKKNATLATLRDQIFGPYDRTDRRYRKRRPPRSAKVQALVKADLKKVRIAHRYALKVLTSLKSR